MDNEELIEKIRALLAKARSTTNEHEAAAFMGKAQELLEKYNIELAAVGDEEEKESVGEDVMREMYGDPWRRAIAQAAARLYYCDMYNSDWFDESKMKWRPSFVIVGQKHNTIVATQMIRYLIDTTRRLALAYSRERAAQLGFERGCGLRLAARLRELHVAALAREAASRKAAEAEGTTLPALYSTALALVKEHMDKLGLKNFGRGTSLNDHSAKGIAAADGVSLAPQVGAGAGGALLLGRS